MMPTLKKALLTISCCCAALGCCESSETATESTEPRISRSETPENVKPPLNLQNFYEDNDTYISGAPGGGAWPTSTPAAQGLDAARLHTAGNALAAVPSSFSLLVIRHGLLVSERYFHGSQPNHSNNIHSASKGVISALVGLLVHHGFVPGLDQTLSSLLPSLSYVDASKSSITLHDLLTMSAGFSWIEDETEYDIEDQRSWVQAIVDLPLDTPPGKKFHYCTGESHLVSAIIAEATGMTTKDFAQQYLFGPLGVSVEHWGVDPQGYNSGGYNFYMTPRALARFALLFLNHGQQGGQQILPASWVAEALSPSLHAEVNYKYGYYWWLTKIGGRDVYKLWGYGGQYAYLVPSADLIVIITNNTKYDFPEMDGDKFLADYVIPAIDPPNTNIDPKGKLVPRDTP